MIIYVTFRECNYYTRLKVPINIYKSDEIKIVFIIWQNLGNYDLQINEIDNLNISIIAYDIKNNSYILQNIDTNIDKNINNSYITLSSTFNNLSNDLLNIIKFSYNISINPIKIIKRECTIRNKLIRQNNSYGYIILRQFNM